MSFGFVSFFFLFLFFAAAAAASAAGWLPSFVLVCSVVVSDDDGDRACVGPISCRNVVVLHTRTSLFLLARTGEHSGKNKVAPRGWSVVDLVTPRPFVNFVSNDSDYCKRLLLCFTAISRVYVKMLGGSC